MVKLADYQLKAIDELKTGSILCGGVGSGKSRTSLGYYVFKECGGELKVNGEGCYKEMKRPRDLYIITTAKKRDSLEWEKECADFLLNKDPELSQSNVKVTIDSWNNIKKYKDVYGSFFIFDEQRLVGSGEWVKAFYNIARKNHWILLTATPADVWSDYIPVFVANGFYKNKTEFTQKHCVYNRYTKYPKIDRYVGERELRKNRDSILVKMADQRTTTRHQIWNITDYDEELYKVVFINRWDPYENCPIQECGKWYYLQRKVVNSDPSRLRKLKEIYDERRRIIVFYNYDYELEEIRHFIQDCGEISYAEWNGHKHENIPNSDEWIYLVQYSAGSEGWNCTSTDTVVFFSQNYSYRLMEQAAGRIDRMDTGYKDLYYYYFRSLSYVDTQIHRAFKNKKKFNEDINFFKKYSPINYVA